jgi:putative ABC transport system permease protein
VGISIIREIQTGIKSLMLHKMRSILTMLGIIFGVCSVIAMLAIGEGASFEAQEAIRKLGSRNIIIRSVQSMETGSTSDSKQTWTANYGLKANDISHLEETVPTIVATLAKKRYRMKARNVRREVACNVWGTEPQHLRMSQVEIKQGRFLTETDGKYSDNVCVLTDSISRALFPAENPIGGTIELNNRDVFEVVGVLQETGTVDARAPGGDVVGEALDANIYIPLQTAHSRLGIKFLERRAGGYSRERVELHEIVAEIDDIENVEISKKSIVAVLESSHKKKDYEIIVPLELLRQAEQTKRIFNIVLGSIAGISLIVGGIGIMNIMLATVTERTREIGIRRALGARKQQIVTQFLVETVVLSITGGVIGVALGVLLPFAVEHFSEMKTIVTLPSVLLAFLISALVGVVFGVYPARRASDLDPIQALRHT